MGWDITIGRIQWPNTSFVVKEANSGNIGVCLNYQLDCEPCEGEEPKGLTSTEFGICSGSPQRSPSYTAWAEFMNSHDSLRTLNEEYINPRSSDGWSFLINVDRIKSLLSEVEVDIDSMTALNQDRAKWLIFWCRKACELYGDDAIIHFA